MPPKNENNLKNDFEKRVSRDKKIIIGAIAVMAIIIILSIISIPYDDSYTYDSYYDDTYSNDYNIDDYPDSTAASDIKVKITDGHEDSDGWYFIYGKITPESTDTSQYKSIAMFYDSDDYLINTDYQYLSDESGELMLGMQDVSGYDLDHIKIGILDENDEIVAKTTYHTK